MSESNDPSVGLADDVYDEVDRVTMRFAVEMAKACGEVGIVDKLTACVNSIRRSYGIRRLKPEAIERLAGMEAPSLRDTQPRSEGAHG